MPRLEEAWIRTHVRPVGPIEMARERPWATVARVPVAEGMVWFKACGPMQAFEPRLTSDLFTRWPDRVPVVLASDEERGWLLVADAGTPLRAIGNPPAMWLRVLPAYAELQRGEVRHARDHLAHGVPDLRIATWPAQFEDLVHDDLPLDREEMWWLRRCAPAFSEWCIELAARNIPASIQHDDLHLANVFTDGRSFRVLDWGDACISHPFASLVITFRFLQDVNYLAPDDPWFVRLRDAYLEPWGRGLEDTFELAMRTGAFARAFAIVRQRKQLPPGRSALLDADLAVMLRRATHATWPA
jgi:Phosphotransferase enzyme family